VAHDVVCVIPRWGRTFARTMQRFSALASDPAPIERVLRVVTDARDGASADAATASRALAEADCPWVGVAPDRKRPERPYRIGFVGMDVQVQDIRLRLEGDEPHNGSSLIRLDEADFAIVGLDELLAMCQPFLRDPSRVNKWGLYNYNLVGDTDLRIAGSAALASFDPRAGRAISDFVGFFLISAPGLQRGDLSFRWLAQHRMPVFVKGRYEDLIHKLFPGMNTVPCANVEEAVLGAGTGAAGIEIVQTGSTVRTKGLTVWGSPLFVSESLFVAHYHRYLRSEKLQKLLEILAPVGYFDDERIEQYVHWYAGLERNLGASWAQRPQPDALFCSLEEMRAGLRPYRLKTRGWTPSDRYKVDEAETLVASSLEKIRGLYALAAGAVGEAAGKPPR
jgi:hypothetical protein